MWGWGMLSGPNMQHIAAAARADGLNLPEVDIMARAGGNGRLTKNVMRDISRHFVGDLNVPEPYVFPVPCLDGRQADPLVVMDCDVLLPHQMFAHIASCNGELLTAWANEGDLRTFWEASIASGDPQLAQHPARERPDFLDRAIPLVLHGDGAAFSRHDSLEVASWGSVCATALRPGRAST
jgi:hypothetical protein